MSDKRTAEKIVEENELNTEMEKIFDILFAEMDNGNISAGEVKEFFPDEVVKRCENTKPVE